EAYLVHDLEQCLAEAGISGDRLILEITESTLLETGPQVSDVLASLRATGARMCLDDFGTGYSSLRYLQQFPIDQLKIDRSFVCGKNGALASEPIVRMLLNLAQTMGLRVVAEGIESEHQSDRLMALGCRLGQGFRFSPARAPRDIDFDRPLAPARTFPQLDLVAEKELA
ncbi:MAG: EAL domain-containing protein, partial [Candidatus Eremiobacteraeota bacterium]|nr:EAL domain-containing protein [Candidatus Eremiobacteraeota bacterium]